MRPDKKAFRVSLSPESLTFDESNWDVAQFVTIDAGELGGWMVAGNKWFRLSESCLLLDSSPGQYVCNSCKYKTYFDHVRVS